MPSSLTSLFWISLCAVIAPLVAGLVPRRLVPEVVLLIIGGVLIGPFVLELAATDEAIEMLRELGLMLVPARRLRDRAGGAHRSRRPTGDGHLDRVPCSGHECRGLIGLSEVINAEIAVAIAHVDGARHAAADPQGLRAARRSAPPCCDTEPMESSAPSSRSPSSSAPMAAGVTAAAGGLRPDRARRPACPSVHLRDRASRIVDLIRLGSETTGQTTVRLTILLLVTLGAVAAVFELDSVLAAFAAGFVLRRALPGGDERLEAKLDGLAFGFLIPVFFVTSGMAIDPGAVAEEPADLAIFVLLILLIRGGWCTSPPDSTQRGRDPETQT